MRSRSIFISAMLMLAGAATVVAASPSRRAENTDPFVVVIDAGHGGKDYGAIGKVTNEKSINLNVARQIRDILAEDAPDIKVVMTRSDDRFVPLAGRATIANKAKGDLFVSIHTNSVDKKNPNRLKVAGASVYSLGLGRTEENLAVAMRENAVMTLEPDYTTTYEGFDPNIAESYIIFEMDRDLHMEQSISAAKAVQEQLVSTARRSDRGVRQAGFLVLRATSMPAILVELDFICNPTQEKYMHSEKGRKELGQAVAKGIINYSDEVARDKAILEGREAPAPRKKTSRPRYDSKQAAGSAKASTADDPERGSEMADPTNEEVFRIQFLTLKRPVGKNDNRIKGLPGPVVYYHHGSWVKYVSGRYATEKEALEALREVKRRYADAFVVRTRGASRL